jgi:hypothetical protein
MGSFVSVFPCSREATAMRMLACDRNFGGVAVAFGAGVHVLTVYPVATDTPMMASSKAGADLGFRREPAIDVAAAIVKGIEADAIEVARWRGEGAGDRPRPRESACAR